VGLPPKYLSQGVRPTQARKISGTKEGKIPAKRGWHTKVKRGSWVSPSKRSKKPKEADKNLKNPQKNRSGRNKAMGEGKQSLAEKNLSTQRKRGTKWTSTRINIVADLLQAHGSGSVWSRKRKKKGKPGRRFVRKNKEKSRKLLGQGLGVKGPAPTVGVGREE